MGEILKRRLKQEKFSSLHQEAMLNLILAASYARALTEKLAAEHGISMQQYNILRILRGSHPDGRRCAEIRDRMLDRSPDITRRLDALENMGLATRARSEKDRRAVVSLITEKGLQLLAAMDQPLKDQVEKPFAERITENECRILSELCEKVYGPDTTDGSTDCQE